MAGGREGGIRRFRVGHVDLQRGGGRFAVLVRSRHAHFLHARFLEHQGRREHLHVLHARTLGRPLQRLGCQRRRGRERHGHTHVNLPGRLVDAHREVRSRRETHRVERSGSMAAAQQRGVVCAGRVVAQHLHTVHHNHVALVVSHEVGGDARFANLHIAAILDFVRCARRFPNAQLVHLRIPGRVVARALEYQVAKAADAAEL